MISKNESLIIQEFQIQKVKNIIDEFLQNGASKKDVLAIFDFDETIAKMYVENEAPTKLSSNVSREIRRSGINRHVETRCLLAKTDKKEKFFFSGAEFYNHMFKTIMKRNVSKTIGKLVNDDKLLTNNEKKLNEDLTSLFINPVLKKTYNYFCTMQEEDIVKIQTVEPDTSNLIEDLQKNEITVMGLTGRGWRLKECTHKQLSSVGILMNKNTISEKEYLDENGGFANGFLFLNPSTLKPNKGAILCRFFDSINYVPKKIVFVDDNFEFLQSVQDGLAKKYPDVEFKGIHYCKTQDLKFDESILNDVLNKKFGKNWWLLEDDEQVEFAINKVLGIKSEMEKVSEIQV